MPTEKQWQDFRESLMSIRGNVADKIEIGKQDEYTAIWICENVRQNKTR